MTIHSFHLEVATEPETQISQLDLAREIALVLAHHGTIFCVEGIRGLGVKVTKTLDAEKGEAMP